MSFSTDLSHIDFEEPEIRSFSRKRSIFYLKTIKDTTYRIFIRKEFCKQFDVFFQTAVRLSNEGHWRTSGNYKDLIFIRFNLPLPKELNCEQICAWAEFVNKFIWRDLGKLPKNMFAGNELDYCLAIDWRVDPENVKNRTELGNAEYLLKYCQAYISEGEQVSYFNQLLNHLNHTYYFLHQVFSCLNEEILISPIPLNEHSKSKLAYRLAEQISIIYSRPLIAPILLQPKPQMKNLSIEDKIRAWQNIYNDPAYFQFNENIIGKTICVIDDLYQSGASMWSYAKFLKERGAKYVFGISCVKTLKDTDNV